MDGLILILMLIIVAQGIKIGFRAAWDAEAFKKGASNHNYKNASIIAEYLLYFGFIIIGKQFVWYTDIQIIGQSLVIFGILAGIRYVEFTPLLNLIRELPVDYKTPKYYVMKRILVLIGIVCLVYIFTLIDKL